MKITQPWRTLPILFAALVILPLLHSCKTKEELHVIRYPGNVEITNNLLRNDIPALISNCVQYTHYQQALRDHLLYEVTYEEAAYSQLTNYRQLAVNDSVLFAGYDHLVKAKEQEVLTYLSDLPMENVAHYYAEHWDEQSFIQPALDSTLLKNLDEYEYYDLHLLHHAFLNTNIQEKIDSVYNIRKAEVFHELFPVLNHYFKEELNIVSNYANYCTSELASFIDDHASSILNEILEDELPEGSSAVDEYFQKTVDKHLDPVTMTSIVERYRKDCINAINAGRAEWINTLMEEMHLGGYTLDNNTGYYYGFHLRCPYELHQLSEIQNEEDWIGTGLSIASFAAGILSGGTTSLLLDVLDLSYSGQKAQSDAQRMEPYIEGLIEHFYTDVEDTFNATISDSFDVIRKRTTATQHLFKKILYENY